MRRTTAKVAAFSVLLYNAKIYANSLIHSRIILPKSMKLQICAKNMETTDHLL